MVNLQTQFPGLLEAMIVVESSDKNHPEGNPNAIGDKHLQHWAYGPLQIRQPYIDDCVSAVGKRKAEECLGNLDLSIKVVNAYMNRYATKKRLGHEPTAEDIARIHNGGPMGNVKAATLPYWEKVQKHYKPGFLGV